MTHSVVYIPRNQTLNNINYTPKIQSTVHDLHPTGHSVNKFVMNSIPHPSDGHPNPLEQSIKALHVLKSRRLNGGNMFKKREFSDNKKYLS